MKEWWKKAKPILIDQPLTKSLVPQNRRELWADQKKGLGEERVKAKKEKGLTWLTKEKFMAWQKCTTAKKPSQM